MNTYTQAIIDTYNSATAQEIASGRAWYATAHAMAQEIASFAGVATDTAASVIAALSPRNPWSWNVQDAAAYCYAAAHGQEMPTATTFTTNRVNAWSFATGEHDWRSSALKVRSFVANIMGSTNDVTVDVWAIRVATAGEQHAVRNDAQYNELRDAYREAAAQTGETARDLQAITWLVAQRQWLGGRKYTVRRPKRGTYEFISLMLGHAVQQSFDW